MSYEITRDCRFGRRGKIVDYPTYMQADYEEKRTCFKEVVTYDSNSHYNSSDSSDSLLDAINTTSNLIDLISSSADDASSFSSSTDSSDHSSFDGFGGGDFGGGGASDDY